MATELIACNAQMRKLVSAWMEAKAAEKQANAVRLAVEGKLYAILEQELPEKGTVRLEAGLKVTCGYNDRWSQEGLQEVRANWSASFPEFPFREELKPDGKSLAYIRDHEPEAYAALATALTQESKKPVFAAE